MKIILNQERVCKIENEYWSYHDLHNDTADFLEDLYDNGITEIDFFFDEEPEKFDFRFEKDDDYVALKVYELQENKTNIKLQSLFTDLTFCSKGFKTFLKGKHVPEQIYITIVNKSE